MSIESIFSDIGTLAVPALFNIYFTVAAMPLAFVLALLLAIVRRRGGPVSRRLAGLYTYAFRGSPLFIQLFLAYTLLLSMNREVLQPSGLDWLLHPLFLGPLVLMLNTTAYAGEIFYGALRSVPGAEIEAAEAFGMSRFQRFRAVEWPNLIRIAWPAYTNEVVFLFHATALVYLTLPVVNQQKDLLSKAHELFERDYNIFLHFGVAALYFLTVSAIVFFIFGRIYRRLMRHTATEPERLRFWPRYLR